MYFQMKSNKTFIGWIILFFTSSLLAQWHWQNPKPTGQDINDASFASSNVGWFVGENGTIFKTEDRGLKWFSQFDLPRYDFKAISAIDENKAWALSLGYGNVSGYPDGTYGFKILKTEDGGKSWITKLDLARAEEKYYLYNLFFIDELTGWLGGANGAILKTEDGGENWNYFFSPTDDYPVRNIQFFDQDTGYISSGEIYESYLWYPDDSSYSFGKILKTTDGGQSWQPIFEDTVMIHDFYFLSQDTGWAVGRSVWTTNGQNYYKDYILYTYDGGDSWHQGICEHDSITPPLKCIYFKDYNTGFAGGYYGEMVKSTDGGKNWTKLNIAQRYVHRMNKIIFSDNANGFIFGSNGAIWQSKNGGNSWENYDSKFIEGVITDVYFINPDTGWFIHDYYGGLFGTTDGGDTWHYQNMYGLRAIDFPDIQNGWVVGDSGLILYSDDMGQSWRPQNSPTDQDLEDVKFYNNQIGYATGRKIVLKTKNGGKNWIIKSNSEGGDEIILQDDQRLWIYGSGGYYTEDGGAIWYNLNNIMPRFFLNPDTGWGQWGVELQRTINGGATWEVISDEPKGNLFFVNSNLGWGHISSLLYSTSDGGSNWKHTLEFDPGRGMNDFHFLDAEHGWFVGSSGSIIRYGYPEKLNSINPSEPTNPDHFILYQNYPNPFNDRTLISFYAPVPARVSLRIFDVLGRSVITLVDDQIMSGHNTKFWGGKNESGTTVSSGIYFYTILTKSLNKGSGIIFSKTKKLILIK